MANAITPAQNMCRKDHGRAKHGGKLYICELCDYATSYESALSSHKKAQHEGVTYQCDLCDNKFNWRSGLKTHRETKHNKQLYVTSVNTKYQNQEAWPCTLNQSMKR